MKTPLAFALTLTGALAIGGAFLLAAPAGSPAIAAPQSDGAFKVDSVHSTMIFKIKHNNAAWFYGQFVGPEGSFNIDWTEPARSTLDVSVKTESVYTGNSQRDKHLTSGDFFSAKEYPTISFKAKSFKKTGEKTVEASGDLTVRGVTRPVTVTLEHTGDGKGRDGKALTGIHGTFAIKRSDFGVTYGLPGLGDDVTVMVGLEGAR